MTVKQVSRRGFLLGSAGLGSVLGLLGGAGSANAFSYQPIPAESPLGLAIANHCKADSEHAVILRELDQELARIKGAPGSYLTRTAYCPICGCPITAVRHIPA